MLRFIRGSVEEFIDRFLYRWFSRWLRQPDEKRFWNRLDLPTRKRLLELKGFTSDEIGVLSNLSWTKLCASLPELIRIELWAELGALEIRLYMDEQCKSKVGR